MTALLAVAPLGDDAYGEPFATMFRLADLVGSRTSRASRVLFRRSVTATTIAAWLAGVSGAQNSSNDKSPPATRFVVVERDVRLEVLDWGGAGRTIVLLAGLGNDAHVFDGFAQKLTADYHVYGITRRGFGKSSVPASGYFADRLGDDVLAVLDSLRLDRVVLVGHSLAGEELSSVGSRHPERVSGLVYLDAAYPYAYYDRARGDFGVDLAEVQRKLDRLWPTSGIGSRATSQQIQELLDVELPALEKNLRNAQQMLALGPEQPPTAVSSPLLATTHAIMAGEQRYTDIRVPVLAIYALPRELPPLPVDSATRRSMLAADSTATAAQADAFERGVPSAHVVRLPHASHAIFISNEVDVLREMRAFIGGLTTARK